MKRRGGFSFAPMFLAFPCESGRQEEPLKWHALCT